MQMMTGLACLQTGQWEGKPGFYWMATTVSIIAVVNDATESGVKDVQDWDGAHSGIELTQGQTVRDSQE